MGDLGPDVGPSSDRFDSPTAGEAIPVAQPFLRFRRMFSRKCGFITVGAIIAMIVVVAIILAATSERKELQEPAPAGGTTPAKSLKDALKEEETKLQSPEDIFQLVSLVNSVFGDAKRTDAVVKFSLRQKRRKLFLSLYASIYHDVKPLLGGDEPPRSRTILEGIARSGGSEAPPSALARIAFDMPMAREAYPIFSKSNVSLAEAVKDHYFVESFLQLWNETLGTMDVPHFDSIGSEVGEDLADEHVPLSEDDLDWFGELHEAVYEALAKKNSEELTVSKAGAAIGDPEDDWAERLKKIWTDEVESQKQFGFSQLSRELEEMNGVQEEEEDDGRRPGSSSYSGAKVQHIRDKLTLKVAESLKPRGFEEGASSLLDAACNPNTELPCAGNASCYFRSERCDRFVNCLDNSDEAGCGCVEYLPSEKLCDGFADCPDGDDEAGCRCPEGRFYCAEGELGPVCVDEARRCDNVYDCADGADERFCLELSAVGRDPDLASVPRSSGIAHVRTAKGWKALSLDVVRAGYDQEELSAAATDYLQDLSSSVCSDMTTFSAETPTYHLVNSDDLDVVDVAHLYLDLLGASSAAGQDLVQARPGGRYAYEIVPPRPTGLLVSVDCGEPVCGVRSHRVTSRQTRDVSAPAWNDDDDLQTRIVGGTGSAFGDWPFVVQILRDGRFVCGGSIVDDRWVLTAAHCVHDAALRKEIHLQVVAGLHRRFSRTSVESPRKVAVARIHEGFNSTWLQNDVAMLLVDEPFDFSYAAAPICLPDDLTCAARAEAETSAPYPGEECISVGWGYTTPTGNSSDQLQEVSIPVLDRCRFPYNDIKYQICAGYEEGGKDSCNGDSGGPLFCRNPDSPDAWYLGGIISHGVGCARPNTPGVYTRVCEYLGWIHETMRMDVSDRSSPSLVFPGQSCKTLTCDGGKCVDSRNLCNIRVDCFDSRDEKFCVNNVKGVRELGEFVDEALESSAAVLPAPTVTTTPAPSKPENKSIHLVSAYGKACASGFFQCQLIHECIAASNRCDMKVQCKDGSDERGCTCRDYTELLEPDKICDGYEDCEGGEDEIGCDYCARERRSDPRKKFYFCSLSKTCVETKNVCDRVHHCTLREDERYCIAVVNGDTVSTTRDGKPRQFAEGLVAVNSGGAWKPVCARSWSKHINDRICQFTGKRESESYELVSPWRRPHLVGSNLPVRPFSARSRARRGADLLRPLDFATEPVGVDEDDSERLKRQASSSSSPSSCSFVDSRCSPHRTCGTMPLYNFLGQETPAFGPGVFPWTANLYKDGGYVCGATLVHRDWVLVGDGCAEKMNPPSDYVVAVLGGYKDARFKSGHEEYARVVQVTSIPGTKIHLARFATSVPLSEHVNVVCVPNVNWIPRGVECVITGRNGGVLNHAFETVVQGRCGLDRDICSREVANTRECLRNWSGALTCPDGTGKYYAVGVYHTEDGGCDGKPAPSRFGALVTGAAREGITRIIRTADDGPSPYRDLEDADCDRSEGKMRCSLGNCIDESMICDGVPNCSDLSDESPELCGGSSSTGGLSVCARLNQTHCECPAGADVRCDNNVCVPRKAFCDGVQDCGDGSDEPEGCESDCAVGMELMEREKICDGNIDCVAPADIGNDESADRCCSGLNYRCALGNPRLNRNNSGVVSFSPRQCIDRRGVCDGDPRGAESCVNGADEADCLSLWPKGGAAGSDPVPTDAFGRFRSRAQGYLYFVADGRSFLYCASQAHFPPGRTQDIGRRLCRHENYEDVVSIQLHSPNRIQRADAAGEPISEQEAVNFSNCQLVYLVCAKDDFEM